MYGPLDNQWVRFLEEKECSLNYEIKILFSKNSIWLEAFQSFCITVKVKKVFNII